MLYLKCFTSLLYSTLISNTECTLNLNEIFKESNNEIENTVLDTKKNILLNNAIAYLNKNSENSLSETISSINENNTNNENDIKTIFNYKNLLFILGTGCIVCAGLYFFGGSDFFGLLTTSSQNLTHIVYNADIHIPLLENIYMDYVQELIKIGDLQRADYLSKNFHRFCQMMFTRSYVYGDDFTLSQAKKILDYFLKNHTKKDDIFG